MSILQNLNSEEIFSLLFASGLMIFTLIVIACSFLVLIALYILQAFAVYRMAKKVGVENAWGAWIPIFQIWVMFQISDKPFKILLFNKEIKSRSNAFWIYMGVVWGSVIILSAVSALSVIPYVGYLFILLSAILNLAYRFVLVLFLYPLYYDIYEIFLPENAVLFAIGTTICSFIAPILNSILLPIAARRDPVLKNNSGDVINASEVVY